MPVLLYANPVIFPCPTRRAVHGEPHFHAAPSLSTRHRHGYQGSPWVFKKEKPASSFFSVDRDGPAAKVASCKRVWRCRSAASLVSCWLGAWLLRPTQSP